MSSSIVILIVRVKVKEYRLPSSKYYQKQKRRCGFTLLETIVALAMILAAVVGPVSLISRGIFNFSFSKNKIIAANLAQEGVELVRLIRDNNIMCDKLDDGTLNGSWKWNRDPETGGELKNALAAVDVTAFTTLTCGASVSTSRLLPPTSSLLKLETDPLSARFGLYNYSSGADSIFMRRINIKVPAAPPDSDISPDDQMDVVSTVEWIERGVSGNTSCPILESRCLTVRERLYNWK